MHTYYIILKNPIIIYYYFDALTTWVMHAYIYNYMHACNCATHA